MKELILRNEKYKNGTFERLSFPGISEYQQAVAGGASALLIVIPKQIPLEQERAWREVELNLITNEFLIPVYFVYESEKLNEIIDDIEKSRESNFIQSANLLGSILNDDYRVIVSTKESSLVKDTKATNIQVPSHSPFPFPLSPFLLLPLWFRLLSSLFPSLFALPLRTSFWLFVSLLFLLVTF